MQDIDFETISIAAFAVLLAYTLFEMALMVALKKGQGFRHEFWQPLKNVAFVGIVQQLLRLAAIAVSSVALATYGSQFALFDLPHAWYIWPVALLVYEFFYWLQHWMGHKVRLFWCIHSPHHAPGAMNMMVGANHHLLESGLYFPIFFGFFPALCGVPVEMILVVALVDIFWGSFLHISPAIIRKSYGPLEYFMQTPSYHRVHHGKNVKYMDTNYNSITLFWDYVMGTRQPFDPNDPVEYGITRDVDTTSWWDVQFGEFALLWRDLKSATRLKDALGFLFMPPGWSPDGNHQTAAAKKAQLAPAR